MKNATKNVRCVTPHTPLGALTQPCGLLRQCANDHWRTVDAPLTHEATPLTACHHLEGTCPRGCWL